MNMKIDFVLPWVDSQDPEWQELRQQHAKNQSLSDANSSARFRDSGTLKYVLRSIEKNCPWYNKIYLITCGHYPKWLDLSSSRIELVSHSDIYDNISHLPVFNSNSIEMNLSNIKGLSEHFVYLNDDTVIFSEIDKERFFINGKPVDFLCHGWIPRNKFWGMIKHVDSWVSALNNNIRLINNYFSPLELDDFFLYHESYSTLNKISNFMMKNIYKKYFWFEHWHHPISYLKSTLIEVKENCFDEMQCCSMNKFRNSSDLTPYLYRYWRLAKGDFYPYKYNDGFETNITSINILHKAIQYCNKLNPNFVCLNDSPALSDDEYTKVKMEMLEFFDKRFPKKASFEL
jgi:hypothetical protein